MSSDKTDMTQMIHSRRCNIEYIVRLMTSNGLMNGSGENLGNGEIDVGKVEF